MCWFVRSVVLFFLSWFLREWTGSVPGAGDRDVTARRGRQVNVTQRWGERPRLPPASVHTAKSNETYSALSLDALHLRLS